MEDISKKIKVLEVTSGLSMEGIGSFLLNVYENIDKDKFDIKFALATKYEQHYEKRLLQQGAEIYRTAEIGDGIKGKIKHFINLIKLIREEGPFDIVHTHMDFFNGVNLLAAFIARTPIRIAHAHLAIDKSQLRYKKKIYNNFMIVLIKLFSNKKLGCSKLANEYMNGVKDGVIINNGININKFEKSYKNVIEVNDKNINFITIGRIEEQKNPLFIVEIIKEIKKINSDIKLYWIGIGTMENAVRQLIEKFKLEDTIILLGKRDDVASILSQMDYMLFPSKWEGLGIVLIEAQISGVPCFISDSIPEEANLGLCKVISLDEDAVYWSKIINNSIKGNSFSNKIDSKLMNLYDIKNVVKKLEKVYLGESYEENYKYTKN